MKAYHVVDGFVNAIMLSPELFKSPPEQAQGTAPTILDEINDEATSAEYGRGSVLCLPWY